MDTARSASQKSRLEITDWRWWGSAEDDLWKGKLDAATEVEIRNNTDV